MILRGVLTTASLAAACGCTVYDQSLLTPAAEPGETRGSSTGAAGGSAGDGGSADANRPTDGPRDDTGKDVSVESGGGSGSGGDATAAAGGNAETGIDENCVPVRTAHATLLAAPILATFESGTHAEASVLPTMYWYSYSDSTGETGVPVGPFFAVPRQPPEDGDKFAGHFTGSGHTSFGGGIGFSCDLPIDASAYSGITFWAKGPGQIFALLANTTTTDGYCKCAGATCADTHRGYLTLTADWAAYTVKWSDLKQLHNAQTFDPSGLLGVGFGTGARDWDYWIDDVALTP